ncbi:MAG: B3/B4 domain-containing protein [Thermodesulfobacteriota bacterium]
MPETRVHEEVFERFPGFRRGIVVAAGLDNQGPSPELECMLQEALDRAAEYPVDLKTDPRTMAWNDAYRALGCNPNKFPPAHLALLKRVQKPGAGIPFINKAVAVMNDNSIRGVLPVGGDDVHRAGGSLELRPARGNEHFTPLSGPDKTEQPEPGEIVYAVPETDEVMCRRWNWRNGFNTRITEKTTALVMNIDGLGEDVEAHTIAVRDRVAQMLEQFCGAETVKALLSPSAPVFKFEL